MVCHWILKITSVFVRAGSLLTATVGIGWSKDNIKTTAKAAGSEKSYAQSGDGTGTCGRTEPQELLFVSDSDLTSFHFAKTLSSHAASNETATKQTI